MFVVGDIQKIRLCQKWRLGNIKYFVSFKLKSLKSNGLKTLLYPKLAARAKMKNHH